jgi:hypothetical protein
VLLRSPLPPSLLPLLVSDPSSEPPPLEPESPLPLLPAVSPPRVVSPPLVGSLSISPLPESELPLP